jgi:hypothetical protein
MPIKLVYFGKKVSRQWIEAQHVVQLKKAVFRKITSQDPHKMCVFVVQVSTPPRLALMRLMAN